MKFPSKVTAYSESILPKFPVVLAQLQSGDMKPGALYAKVKRDFDNVEDFIEVLDCLYALKRIDIDESWGTISLVG